MRQLVLLPLICLSLVACGKQESEQDIQQVDQALANDDLIDNDLTAIDAITGADGNMAADVDSSDWNRDGGAVMDGPSQNKSATTRSPAPAKRQEAEEKPATDTPAPTANASETAD